MMKIHTMQCNALHCNDTISKRKWCISHGRHAKMHCTPRCYNDVIYNLYEIKISVLDGFGRHATMTTNDCKILGREKPISKHPYKDKMVERRLSEQKVPFQDTKIPNLATVRPPPLIAITEISNKHWKGDKESCRTVNFSWTSNLTLSLSLSLSV